MTKTPVQLMFEKQEYETVVSTTGLIPTETARNSTMVVCGNGTYLVRKNPIGVFVRQVTKNPMPGLPDGPSEGSFVRHLPVIPETILQTQVNFYREVMKRHNEAESYTMILWDLQTLSYLLVCPKQRISKGGVKYDLGTEWSPDRYMPVVSCHSHNTMGAFWSGTDDADEKGDMCYMVMGTLDKSVPTFKIRASVAGGQAKDLSLENLFETTSLAWEERSPQWNTGDFPQEWLDNLNVEANYVSIHKVQGGASRSYFSEFAKEWPTQQGSFEQLSLSDFGPHHGGEKPKGVVALRAAANVFLYNLRKRSASRALEELLGDIFDAGYGADIVEFVDELVELTDEEEVALTDEGRAALAAEEPWWNDLNHLAADDGSQMSFEQINDYISNMTNRK